MKQETGFVPGRTFGLKPQTVSVISFVEYTIKDFLG